MPISLRTLCLVTAILCNVQRSLGHEYPRRSFLSRRAIDGTRGRKYFDPHEEGTFDSYGSAGGQYDPYDHMTDLSDIRRNVPGEPGVDYPAYTTLPQTGFTCEGRSRGYYADEAAGCQVFHVCHDVLVSSFLCPIGSTFSQKLLTCDWWNKVDCSTTRRYLGVNRNSYQIDDDEMIRNAYAMISLQSAEDVTKDGLVDPDSGARIIDYSALAGRTASYPATQGLRRITDYPSIDATGNDLPNGFEDYPYQNHRRVLDGDRYRQGTRMEPDKLQFAGKAQSPYHASLIIRPVYQDRTGDNEFQDVYVRRLEGFTHRLQSSYAPTVPTVTTTTRRLYSPTVPTTYRPSTLAYSKLDLSVDSSDHLYAHSKGLGSLMMTPPTTGAHRNDDPKNIRPTDNQTRYDERERSETASSTGKADVERPDSEKKSEIGMKINVTDETFRRQNDKRLITNDSGNEENLENIETEGSVGIVRAMNNVRERIATTRSQDPIDRGSKNERGEDPVARSSGSRSKADNVNSRYTTRRPDTTTVDDPGYDRSTEDYDDTAISTTASYDDVTSTVSTDTHPAINVTGIDGSRLAEDRSNDSRAVADQNSSPSGSFTSYDDDPVRRIDTGFEVPKPAQFLEPPSAGFLISVPEGTRYPTIGSEAPGTSWYPVTTVGTPRFSVAPENNRVRSSVYSGGIDQHSSLIDYEGPLETPDLRNRPADPGPTTELSTANPWLVTWHDGPIVTDIIPPVVDYNDGFDDFVPPDRDHPPFDHTEHAGSRTIDDSPIVTRNDTVTELLDRYNAKFQFTIRNAVRTRPDSRTSVESFCHFSTSAEQARLCGTTSTGPKIAIQNTPDARERTTPFGTKATTTVPERVTYSVSTKSPEKSLTYSPKEYSVSTRSSIGGDVAVDSELDSISKDAEEGTDVTTISNLLHSSRPASLKRIEEPTAFQRNSPYQVSLTVEKDENLETTVDGFVGRLIAQRDESPPVAKDHTDDFEIVRSVERGAEIIGAVPHARGFSDTNRTAASGSNGSLPVAINDMADQSKGLDTNVSMLGLLQVMAELLKLDRLPRPFAAKDLRSVKLKTSLNLGLDEPPFVTADSSSLERAESNSPYADGNFNASPSDDTSMVSPNSAFEAAEAVASTTSLYDTIKSEENSIRPLSGTTSRPPRKEAILEQLAENLGQPLYGRVPIYRSLIYDLPQVQRHLDFETGLPIKESKDMDDDDEEGRTTSPTTTSTAQKTTTSEAEKTIVETELVPSLGFSLDTNEGRDEYVEAVLGGLIDEHAADGDGKTSNHTRRRTHAPGNDTSTTVRQRESPRDTEQTTEEEEEEDI